MSAKIKQRDYQPQAPGPLAGVRVLDLSRLVAGNALTQVLADFGAEVIKIESPSGDTLRDWKTADVQTNWKLYARNKKSLGLQLRSPKARDLLLALVPSAAVLVESFRPGTLEKMGLAPELLLERNPKLIVVRISGFGQDGPYAQRPGFGTLIEGMSGFASFNGFADREPVLPPMYLADTVAGLCGANGVLIALREVERGSGRGQVIDLPLLDPLLGALGPQAANYRLTGEVKPRTGSRSTNIAPRNVYRTRDGNWVCLSGATQGMVQRLFRAIGQPALIDDPRFRSNADRVKNVETLDSIIGAFVASRTQAENIAHFERAEVTVGPIYDVAQILQDPHVLERGLIAEYPDADMGRFPMTSVVPRLQATPGSIRTPAPRLGEHNRELLSELGLGEADCRDLATAGVLCETPAPAEPVNARARRIPS